MDRGIVVGICRFSFLGRGDWRDFRQDRSAGPERMAARARALFDPARLAARFRTFETLCLPSILAQRDPAFVFLVIASGAMPRPWRDRLAALCEPHDQIHLIWSDTGDIGAALAGPLTELHQLSGGRLWQFRLDDDDALAADYLPRLRRHAARIEDLEECAISFARGLAVAIYEGQPLTWLESRLPFQSAGLALRLAQPGRSIFAFGHLALARRFSHVTDHQATGALMLKWASDSLPLNLSRLPPYLVPIEEAAFAARLAADFPFLAGLDFQTLRPGSAPPGP